MHPDSTSRSASSAPPTWLNRPLAVVGMACRLPGADGLEQFWQLLSTGGYAVERMPDSKINRKIYFNPEKGKRGKTYSDVGGFVSERPLDLTLLGIDAAETVNWDECHLNFCEIAALACKHAGYDPLDLPTRKVGVFVGHSGGSTLGGEIAYRTLAEDYVDVLDQLSELSTKVESTEQLKRELLGRIQEDRPQRVSGKPYVDAGFASALVSRLLGLDGPHMSIDAACASSLVALALGACSLHSGESEMAIIGGASFNKSDSLILFSHAQSSSAHSSRPFDSEADGLISSEGYVALAIKTLEQAESDGDTIQAVIRGIGVSSDGRGKSLWAPRKEGQFTAIERAYSGNVTPDTVQMIEAHATSTQLGDATEMEALATFYEQHTQAGKKIPVGSVKSNIGHTLETAGLAGLVKSILAIQNGVIPPSINVTKLSDSIPWDRIPIYVAQRAEPWPATSNNAPRRAAVNAFGIGGLNVHVVVDQYCSSTPTQSPNRTQLSKTYCPGEPIAVIGRGVILPGIPSIEALERFLLAPTNQFSNPPKNRPSHRQAGFITDFVYDWRKHKVPPKQIAQANPLQFMLLEAAEQALREAGLLEQSFDRQHTAVVVGSVFGGDFGNELFAGLRLPEFRDHLQQLLMRRGLSESVTIQLLDQFEKTFLENYPALLDETGSFTSSTLASRLSKTFDLMGGAMAIDAGDTSGMAALNAACQLLRSGSVSQVLCASAQRALDQAAMENLAQLQRLPNNGSGYEVAEGVTLLILKRLRDAEKSGDKVWATIGNVAVGFDANSLSKSMAHASQRLRNSSLLATDSEATSTAVGRVGIPSIDNAVAQSLTKLTSQPLQNSPTLKHLGHLQATQGPVDLILHSVQTSRNPGQEGATALIASHTLSGQSYLTDVAYGMPQKRTSQLATEHTLPVSPSSVPEELQVYTFQAPDSQRLAELLAQASQSPGTALGTALGTAPRTEPAQPNYWRAAVVATRSELSRKCQTLATQLGNNSARLPMHEQGLFWAAPEEQLSKPKIAFLFPGQGSQANGMLRDLIETEPVASQALREANELLRAMGEPTFEDMAWSQSELLGEDVWHTQACMLVADWIMYRLLISRGIRPDVVTGHSFGEFAAMIAAGAWDFASALLATRYRCQAISAHIAPGFSMLSVQADHTTTQSIIDRTGLPLTISHINAPQQTVVGGKQAAIAQLAQALDDEGLTTRLLSVPTAFHTPALSSAVNPFRASLGKVDVTTPSMPLFSGITNAYVSDANEMRDNLAQQLTRPLNFAGAIRKLRQDGVNLAIEVGPQQVLTRLSRQIDPQLHVVASDNSRRGTNFQLACVHAFVSVVAPRTSIVTSQELRMPDKKRIEPLHFDATLVRKNRLRQSAGTSVSRPMVAPTAPVHFDATDSRRQAHRAQAQSHSPNQSIQPSPATTPAPAVALVAPMIAQDGVPAAKRADENRTETIAKFLIDFVVEQTGYPADIIELDWDIEADLGIDSIKKAQLFGELREFFDLESHKDLKLDSFHTLRDIVGLLENTPGKGDWLNQPTNTATSQNNDQDKASIPVAAPQVHESATQAGAAEVVTTDNEIASPESDVAESSLNLNRHELQKFLVDFVVEQTGYPPEIVEMDADLEADLGIDSIKKAQLFGELREMFNFKPSAEGASERGSLADFRTLGHVLEVLAQNAQYRNPDDFTSEAPPLIHETIAQSNSLPSPAAVTETTQPSRPPQSISSSQPLSFELDFAKAVQSNLVAFASRRDGNEGSFVPQNGNAEWYNIRAERLATETQTLDKNLCAFDRALQWEARWKPIKSVATCNNASTVAWIAQLPIPSWLQTAKPSLAALRDEVTELAIPGSLTPTAQISNSDLLRVGGVKSDSNKNGLSQLKLARFLHELVPSTFIEAIEQARSLRLEHDWWLAIVDSQSSKQAYLESVNGTLVIEKSDLKANAIAADSTRAAVGVDLVKKQFVILHPGDGQPTAVSDTAFGFAPPPTNTEAIASRYILRMSPAPQKSSNRQPEWSGDALVVGDNPVARQLEARLRGVGVTVHRLSGNDDPMMLANQFQQLCAQTTVPHLFITTPCDPDARTTLEAAAWSKRRNKGLLGNFWLCQKWLSHIIESELTDDASIVVVSSLGGDFGIGAASTGGSGIHSVEGGGLAGLLKSMLIESWMQGYRALPIKILDTDASQSPAEVVNQIWQELAVPSYDIEVSYREGVRHVVRAIARPIQSVSNRISTGSTWVCTGGARGITAYVAEQLGRRYGLKLHLLGLSPVPSIDPSWHNLNEDELRRLKAKIMTEARDAGKNPVKTWQDTEKLIEIDATMIRFRELGIEAYYHSCDVSDRVAVRRALEEVRRISGPIEGVLHGAGVGRDSRFDRKQPDKVEQCIAAKVDGALSLMDATQPDPLKYFIGFGSISGRFGANGHTDYSLANDMLAKEIDWFKSRRPDVKAVTFHWHAWGDVGMATKPETRLALEMIDMQFMPATEGVEHLIRELESSDAESEVLITDDRYYRMFYPAETIVESVGATRNGQTLNFPLLGKSVPAVCGGELASEVIVDPSSDPFLTEHLLDSKPLMPFVVAAEMLYEAARKHLKHDCLTLEDIEATGALRFFHGAPQSIRLESSTLATRKCHVNLFSDFTARDGRLVEANRRNFKAVGSISEPSFVPSTRVMLEETCRWQKVTYPALDSKFYVGWPLQRLRKVAVARGELVGRISAPALVELAGGSRDVRGWRIPSAAMDACMFATGILAWQQVASGTALPVKIGQLSVGRLPAPGEACEVHVRLRAAQNSRATFDFTLYGVDSEPLLDAINYEVAWLTSPGSSQDNTATSITDVNATERS